MNGLQSPVTNYTIAKVNHSPGRYDAYWAEETANENQFDELAFGGCGNMGLRYLNNWDLRDRIFQSGLPVTVLPQSFNSEESYTYRRVYVRERVSLAFCPDGILSPDLAMGLQIDNVPPPRYGLGVFLRRDRERIGHFR